MDFASGFVCGFFLEVFGKTKSCQRFFCRALMIEVSLQILEKVFLHFLGRHVFSKIFR